jgi:hypothetical protein
MPNPGKPAHVKSLIGARDAVTPTIVTAAPLGDVPEPPRRLEESGLALWREAWQHGWLSRVADITAVSLLCERLDERDLLRAYVLDNPDAWRERASLRKLEEQIEASLKSLLLNPAERIRAGVAEAKAQSKLEQLLAAKADRG